jgi:UPF0716 family protein affecting phage T7 exclusion
LRSFSPLPGLLAFVAWIAAEIIAFNLVASWTGGALAFFLLVMKSVLGAVFVKRAVARKLFDLLRRREGAVILEGAAASEAWFKGLGGALLIAPGFVTGAMGLALLTPSVRRVLLRRGAARMQNPRDIELRAEEWRELSGGSTKRLRRRKRLESE